MAKKHLTNEVKKQILLKELSNQHLVDYFIDKMGGLDNIISLPNDWDGRHAITNDMDISLESVYLTYTFCWVK